MQVIGFTGESPVNGKHAGKDTAAKFLADYLRGKGAEVRVQAWADKLKVSAARALGFKGSEQECIGYCDHLKVRGEIRIQTWGDEDEDDLTGEHTITGREFLEFLGTEGGRDVHGQNVWIDLALPAPDDETRHDPEFLPGGKRVDVVIDTTTRFPNEVARIREWGGKIIRIERPGVENPPGQHVSKYGVPAEECDAVIINDGTLEDLERKVIDTYEVLFGG